MERIDCPLAGARVLDLTDEAGVYAARLLADLGADVVRVEDPAGDRVRTRGPFVKDIPGLERSFSHLWYNAGKRSVRFPASPEAEESLLHWADVVLAPISPSANVRQLLEPARLAARHAHLAIIELVGRRDRPEAPVSDLTGVAAGGLLWLNGYPEDPPNYPVGFLGYKQVALAAAVAAAAVLRAQAVGGSPRRVTVSLQEAAAWTTLQTGNQNAWVWEHRVPGRTAGVSRGVRTVWPTADGRWVSFVVPPADFGSYAAWVAEVLGDTTFLAPEWDDPHFRAEQSDVIDPRTEALVASMSSDELVSKGQARHLLVCPLNDLADLATDKHLLARGFYKEVHQPALGEGVTLPVSVFRLGGKSHPTKPAPAIGEHTEAVLAEAEVVQRQPAEDAPPRLPLEGVRVLDFCWLIAGPLSTRLLADLGADVIKVESSARLDRVRGGETPSPRGLSINTSPVFNDCNTNKRSVTINLSTAEGIAIVKRLVGEVDVVTSNFTPNRMDRWGLGYDDLRTINPGIIVASMPVMGREGPHAGWGAYGNGVMAMSGISSLMGFPQRPPIGLGTLHSDFTAPYYLAVQVIAALRHRDRTAEGQFLETAQFETAIALLDTELIEHLNGAEVPPRQGNRSRFFAPHGVFRAAGDDSWIAIMVSDDSLWPVLCHTIDRPDLAARPELATLAGRKRHEDEIEEALEAWTSSRSREEAAALLRCAGIAAEPVNSVADNLERDAGMSTYFATLAHPETGTILVQQEPVLWDGERLPITRAPLFGEHTYEVVSGLLGIDDEEFARLVASGVLT